MLIYLKLVNFAIVEELEVEFGCGLTAITGETGAGKSLLVNALDFVLGGRASTELVRYGTDRTAVEAGFDVDLSEINWDRRDSLGINLEVDELLILRREFKSEGKGRAWLNGLPVPLRDMRDLGDSLVDIHGQHEHQSLLRPHAHLSLLDSFSDCVDVAKEVLRLRTEVDGLDRQIQQGEIQASERHRLLDYLQYQVLEIEKANLSVTEEEELLEERSRLGHVERLRELTSGVLCALVSDETDGVCASDLLGESFRYLEEAVDLDPVLADIRSGVERALSEVQDVMTSLERYVSDLEADPQRLEEVEHRLSQISVLKKKYGGSMDEILKTLTRLRMEIDGAERAVERIPEMRTMRENLMRQLRDQADVLSGCRRAGAMQLGEQISKELAELGLSQGVFSVDLQRHDGECPGRNGWESAEFLFSANPGEPLRPLRHIASGGEISRVMMALKTVLSEEDRIPTLVFDEVDANVGGRLGEVIGQKLGLISEKRQVLCITHLPQVAARADQHLKVAKNMQGDRTCVQLQPMEGEERLKEIASMLAGDAATDITMAQAAELFHRRESRFP